MRCKNCLRVLRYPNKDTKNSQICFNCRKGVKRLLFNGRMKDWAVKTSVWLTSLHPTQERGQPTLRTKRDVPHVRFCLDGMVCFVPVALRNLRQSQKVLTDGRTMRENMYCNNICELHKVHYHTRKGKSVYGGTVKRCSYCAKFIHYLGVFCPCCKTRLKSKPKRKIWNFTANHA